MELGEQPKKELSLLEVRGIDSNEYKLTDKINNKDLVASTQKLLIHKDSVRKSNRTKRNFSFTEFIKTEVEEKQKRYLKTMANSSRNILGEYFNPEAYLLPQRFTVGDPMKLFKFNQKASDNTPFNRTLWDIRDPKYDTHTYTYD